MSSTPSPSSRPGQGRPLRDALDPVTSKLPSLTGTGNTLHIVKEALMTPFQSEANRHERMKVFGDLAPHIMGQKMLGPGSSSSSQALGLYRPHQKQAPILLSKAMDEELPEPNPANNVSLIRGFKATMPSSEMAKQRRRRVRGGLADEEVGGSKMGLKRLGDKARGLLTEGDHDDEHDHQLGNDLGVGRKQRRRRMGARRGSVSAARELSMEELAVQADEIGIDKDNLRVRRELIVEEIDDVTAKIDALDQIRERLESSLVLIQEEELELDDELEGVKELMVLPQLSAPTGVGGSSATGLPTPSRSSRRKHGPAFLPSEHDDLPHGVAFMTLEEHSAPITALDFTEPYGTLVTAGQDDIVRVWDLCDGQEIGRLRGHTGTVKAVQVEDNVCLTGGSDGNVRLWDLRLVEDYEDKAARADVDVAGRSPLDRHTAEPSTPANVRDGEEHPSDDAQKQDEGNPCVRTLEGHSKAVTALYYEEGCLVTGSSDKTIRQWDVNTGQCILTMDILWAISNPPAVPVMPTMSSPRRPKFTSRFSTNASMDDYDDMLPSPGGTMLGLPGGGLLSSVTGNFAVPTPPYSDGSWEMYQDFVGGLQFWGYALASGSGDGGVRMWDMRTGQAHRTLVGHTGPVTCLQFDETYIISGSLDKTIRTWDLRMGSAADVLKYEFPVTALQFDTRKIVACTGENGIDIYSRTAGTHSKLTINGHVKPAERLRFMDKYLVSGGKDGLAKVWAL